MTPRKISTRRVVDERGAPGGHDEIIGQVEQSAPHESRSHGQNTATGKARIHVPARRGQAHPRTRYGRAWRHSETDSRRDELQRE